ncbi:MAG: AAA family ATPase [Aestuariivirga sp.]
MLSEVTANILGPNSVGILYGDGNTQMTQESEAPDNITPPQSSSGYGTNVWLDENKPYVPTPWIIRETMPQNSVGFIAGPSGSGKSFFVLDFAAAIMDRGELAGRKIEKKGGAIYVAAEGEGTVADRMIALRSKLPDPEKKLPLVMIKDPIPLKTDLQFESLSESVGQIKVEMNARLGIEPVVMFIDTVMAAGLIGEDQENDAAAWQDVVNKFRPIATTHNITIVLVHHYGKSLNAGMRGSSGAIGAGDFQISVIAEKDQVTGLTRDSSRQLTLVKSRNAAEGPIAGIAFETVVVGKRPDGSDVTSLVPRYTPLNGSGMSVTSKSKPGPKSANLMHLNDAFNEIVSAKGSKYHVHDDPKAPVVDAVRFNDLLEEFEKRAEYTGRNEDTAKRDKAFMTALSRAIANRDGAFAQYGKGDRKVVWRAGVASKAIGTGWGVAA